MNVLCFQLGYRGNSYAIERLLEEGSINIMLLNKAGNTAYDLCLDESLHRIFLEKLPDIDTMTLDREMFDYVMTFTEQYKSFMQQMREAMEEWR